MSINNNISETCAQYNNPETILHPNLILYDAPNVNEFPINHHSQENELEPEAITSVVLQPKEDKFNSKMSTFKWFKTSVILQAPSESMSQIPNHNDNNVNAQNEEIKDIAKINENDNIHKSRSYTNLNPNIIKETCTGEIRNGEEIHENESKENNNREWLNDFPSEIAKDNKGESNENKSEQKENSNLGEMWYNNNWNSEDIIGDITENKSEHWQNRNSNSNRNSNLNSNNNIVINKDNNWNNDPKGGDVKIDIGNDLRIDIHQSKSIIPEGDNLVIQDIKDLFELPHPHAPCKIQLSEDMLSQNKDNFDRNTPFFNIQEIYETISNILVHFNPSRLSLLDDEEAWTVQISDDLNEVWINKIKDPDTLKRSWLAYDSLSNLNKWNSYVSPCFKSNSNTNIFRDVMKDGDSFYRAFIFSYLEKCIIQKNILQIKKIVLDITSKLVTPFPTRNVEINQDEILFIFSLIWDAVEYNSISEGIKILNSAMCLSENFNSGLIKWVKVLIGEYIVDNIKNIREAELTETKLVSKSYFNDTGFLGQEYVADRILKMQTEPEIFALFLIPFVFDIAQLSINTLSNSKIIFKSKVKEMSICLSHESQSYKIIYSESYWQESLDTLAYEIVDINSLKAYHKISLLSKNVGCVICKHLADEIRIYSLPFMFCKHCLVTRINEILIQRLKYWQNDGYANIEYYTAPLLLTISENYKIYDIDLLNLIDKTIYEQWLFLISSSCLKCGNVLSEDLFIIWKCKCKLCKNCVSEWVKKDTNDKKLLTDFEKRYIRAEQSLCLCGNIFDVDDAISWLYTSEEIDEFKQDAVKRQISQAKNYCIECVETQSVNSLNIFSSIVVENEQVVKNHIICINCLTKEKRQFIGKKHRAGSDKKVEEILIDCKVCSKEHMVKWSELNKNIKGKDNNCCIIY